MDSTWIVECATCGQPWEVLEPMYTTPGGRAIRLPTHSMLTADSQPMPIECAGSQRPGIGLGQRKEWEGKWGLRHGGRPLPKVFDGSAVQIA